MTITVNGYETLLAAKVESTAGTAIAVGAGDRIDAKSISLSAKYDQGRDEDSLSPTVKKTWLKTTIPNGTIEAYLPYWGVERLFAILMGGCTASAHPDGHPLVGVLEFDRDTIAKSLTAAFSLGEGHATADILRVLEVCGLRFASAEFSQENGAEASASWEFVGKAQTRDSATNTSTNLDEVTFLDASYPSRPVTFDDVTIRAAHQDSDTFGSGQNIDASGYTLKIMTGIPTDTAKHLSTNGALLPVQLERRGCELTLTFLRDDTNSDVFRQYAEDNEKVKILIDNMSTEGVPGLSVSDSSPSKDISGSSNSKLKITLTDEVTAETESKEVTLTLTGLTSGALIAAAIQTAFRAVTATNSRFQRCWDKLTCDYNSTVSAKYAIGIASNERVSPTVVAASSVDLAPELKLGTPGSGDEYDAVAYRLMFFIPEIVFAPVPEEVSGGVSEVEFNGVASTAYGATAPYGFDADDDDHLSTDLDGDADQDIRIVVVGRVLTSPIA